MHRLEKNFIDCRIFPWVAKSTEIALGIMNLSRLAYPILVEGDIFSFLLVLLTSQSLHRKSILSGAYCTGIDSSRGECIKIEVAAR